MIIYQLHAGFSVSTASEYCRAFNVLLELCRAVYSSASSESEAVDK